MLVRGAQLEHVQFLIKEGKSSKEAQKEAETLFNCDETLPKESQLKIRDLMSACCYGQHDANWLAWLEFFRNELKLTEETDEVSALIETAKELHWWLPFENLCLASERPIEFHVRSDRGDNVQPLHNEKGPVVKYSDGFSLYSLNGVLVPESLVETPADKLEAKLILKEKNAEIRREIVRKIGIERVCLDLGAKITDKMDDYELLLLDLQDGRHRPYLKMINPSIGTFHIEGVHPDCKTVKEALAWRNSVKFYQKPEVLT
jgi:hypothetical protein